MSIDLSALTEADRGRIVLAARPLEEPTVAVLVNWNDRFAFLAVPNEAPPSGGHSDPRFLVATDRFATLAYRYGLQYRPCSLGAQPRGFIPDPSLVPVYGKPDWENPEKRFGCLDYPEKLSDEDVKAYELHYFGPVWRFSK